MFPKWYSTPVHRGIIAMRQISIVLLSCLVLLSGCSFNSYHATVQKTATSDIAAGDSLTVESRNGSIEVLGDSKLSHMEISAEVTCGGDDQAQADQRIASASLEVVHVGQAVTIRPIFPEPRHEGDSASFVVKLPHAAHVSIETSNGNVHAENLTSQLAINTSNGSVKISRQAGQTRITTSNGSATINGMQGELTLNTSNGRVTVDDFTGSADIKTSNSSVNLMLASNAVGPIHVATSNGSITASVGAAFAGIIRLNTSNGTIHVNDAAGRIKSKRIDDNSGEVSVGDGQAESLLKSSNGRIELTVQP
jgi:hypothetical protein